MSLFWRRPIYLVRPIARGLFLNPYFIGVCQEPAAGGLWCGARSCGQVALDKWREAPPPGVHTRAVVKIYTHAPIFFLIFSLFVSPPCPPMLSYSSLSKRLVVCSCNVYTFFFVLDLLDRRPCKTSCGLLPTRLDRDFAKSSSLQIVLLPISVVLAGCIQLLLLLVSLSVSLLVSCSKCFLH